MSNWPLTMDQTQILSLKTLKKVNIRFASVMPSSTYKSVKKNFGDNIVYDLQLGTPTILD